MGKIYICFLKNTIILYKNVQNCIETHLTCTGFVLALCLAKKGRNEKF